MFKKVILAIATLFFSMSATVGQTAEFVRAEAKYDERALFSKSDR